MKKNHSRPQLFWIATALLGTSFFSGCAHMGSSDSVSPSELSHSSPVKKNPSQEMVVRGVKLTNTDFDYPVKVNEQVEKWVEYFTGRGRPHFEKYLERSEYFIPYIAPILEKNDVPKDLVFQAMIESGFHNHAKSRAKAVGPWQFISYTAKNYGLTVNWWVDERRDILKSTEAAIGYMKMLHKGFGSWELASAAYNAGEAKIARAVRRFGSNDFWELSRHTFLKPETRHYVPKLIAATIIVKNRTQFGFPAKYSTNGKTLEEMQLEIDNETEEDAPKTLGDEIVQAETQAEDEGANTEVTNPDEMASAEPGEEGGEDREPAAMVADMEPTPTKTESPRRSESARVAKAVATPTVSRQGEVMGSDVVVFEVQSPADLLQIAKAAGISYDDVKHLNPEILRWVTPPMQKTYRIKLPKEVKTQFLSSYNHPEFPREIQFKEYKVRAGDTLKGIARRFGISVDPIRDMNGISKNGDLRQKRLLFLPLPNDPSRSISSLDVQEPRRSGKRKSRRHSSRVGFNTINQESRKAARASPDSVRL